MPKVVESCSKASKDTASLIVYTRIIFFGWGRGFFVSDITNGGLLGHLCPLCLAQTIRW